MIKRYISNALLAALITLFYSNTFADPTSNLYQCPTLNSFLYNDEQGQLTANYKKNNITTQWYTTSLFYMPDLSTLTFVRANANDCRGYSCNIECVYKVRKKHGDKAMTMFILHQTYQFYQAASKNWKNGTCVSSKASDCPFYIVKHKIY